jgi:hypothetical protein
LKNKDQELFIHSEIEWNVDKKYLRDPIVTPKVIKAREEYIKRVKELASKEYEQEKVNI